MTGVGAPRVLPTGKLPGDILDRLVRRVVAVKTDPITFATDRVATYLVDVNANDLACLGVRPRWMVVTSLLPEGKTTEAEVEAQFRDLHAACARHGIAL